MTTLISIRFTRAFILGVASSVWAASAFAQQAAPSVMPETAPAPAVDKPYFFSGHLELGFSLATYGLRDNKSARFLGSIDELKKDSTGFVTPTIGWAFCRFAALQLDYEEYRARTYTDTENNHSDGVVVMKGPVAYLVGRAPLDAFLDAPAYPHQWPSRVTPLAGLGYTLMDASMSTASWWALGYSSQEQYEALGSPSERNNGYYRSFKLDNAYALTYMLGLSTKITDRISVDVTWTRADVDIDSAFYLAGNPGGTGTIPFHYDSFTAGLKYLF